MKKLTVFMLIVLASLMVGAGGSTEHIDVDTDSADVSSGAFVIEAPSLGADVKSAMLEISILSVESAISQVEAFDSEGASLGRWTTPSPDRYALHSEELEACLLAGGDVELIVNQSAEMATHLHVDEFKRPRLVAYTTADSTGGCR